MRGVDDAALEERQLVVEFEAVDVERLFRGADPPQRFLRKQALVGHVMDRQDGRDVDRIPREIGGDQRRLPIVGVDQIRSPVLVQKASRQLGRRRCKTPEANVVIGPVAPRSVAVWIAWPVIELRTQQDVNRQAVFGRCQPK